MKESQPKNGGVAGADVDAVMLRYLAEHTNDVPYALDPQGRVLYVGAQVRHYGLDPEAIRGRPFLELVAEADSERLRQEFRQSVETGAEYVSCFRIRTPTGIEVWLEDFGQVQRNEAGQVAGLTGFLRDVTERKQTERDLAAERSRLRQLETIVAHSPAMVFLWALADGFPVEYVSDNVVRLGYSPEDLVSGKVSWCDITHPEDIERLRAEVERHLAEGREDFSQNYRLRDAAGAYRWIQDWNHVLRNAAGKATHIQGILLDVSQQHESALALRHSQEALRESEENFRALADNAGEAIVIETADGVSYANPYACELTGYGRDELLAMEADAVIAADQREKVADITRRRLAGEAVPTPYESAIVTRDGRRIPVEVTAAATVWQGRPATIGMLRDTSQREAAERALRNSEQMLARAQAIAGVGSWAWDPDGGALRWSDQMYRLHGYEPAEVELCDVFVERHLHPADREALLKAVRQALAEGTPFRMEYRILCKDGSERVVLSQGEVDTAPDGTRRLVGASLDVTEMRGMEREIIEVSDRERQSVGRDIHDTLGQELAGTAFLLQALQKQLAGAQSPLADQAGQAVELVNRSLELARRMAHGLSPVDVSEEGLATELRGLARRTGELYGLRCECSIASPGLVRNNTTAMHLFYIAREAVANAVRHGKADRIEIDLRTGVLGRLTVSDNGTWQDGGRTHHGGAGLRIMKHRAAIIRGSLTVKHGDGEPTTVTCLFDNHRGGGAGTKSGAARDGGRRT